MLEVLFNLVTILLLIAKVIVWNEANPRLQRASQILTWVLVPMITLFVVIIGLRIMNILNA